MAQRLSQCLISFGANIGNSLETIHDAASVLQQALQVGPERFRMSRMFRTPPIGGPVGQPPFVNAVAAIETQLSVWDVWEAIQQTELRFGRRRDRRWEARRIDLDILLYDYVRIWTPQLKVPHPRMCMRRFILLPATDVARDWRDPVSGQTIGELSSTLESSAACLTLVSTNQSRAVKVLEEAASQAVAQWRPASETVQASSSTSPTEAPNRSRWVTLLTPSQLIRRECNHQANLLIYLADSISMEGGVWEDSQRDLAVMLNLAPRDKPAEPIAKEPPMIAETTIQHLHISGPRYLLPSDDHEWAIHEIVSALEAMDCSVEPVFP